MAAIIYWPHMTNRYFYLCIMQCAVHAKYQRCKSNVLNEAKTWDPEAPLNLKLSEKYYISVSKVVDGGGAHDCELSLWRHCTKSDRCGWEWKKLCKIWVIFWLIDKNYDSQHFSSREKQVEGNCARDMVGKGKEPQYFRVSDCSRAITDAKIYKLVPC